uniref:8-oxoguanine DNA glycosylase N-terminal domain-containing protein n=1 Tax=Hucho hucho TaxID=62062 RepID=A0A4W5MTZ6_9TELE
CGGDEWGLSPTLLYYTYNSPNTTGWEEGRGPASGVKGVREEIQGRDGGGTAEYFQLKVKLGDLYTEWGATDPHFQHIANTFTGVCMTVCVCVLHPRCENAVPGHHRVPVLLCLHLQQPDLSYPGQLDKTIYHNFPSLHALADSSVEACLKELGFGYRARFRQQILDSHGGPQWLPAGRGCTAHSAQGGPQGMPQPFRAIKGASPKGAAEEWLSMNQLYVVSMDHHKDFVLQLNKKVLYSFPVM